MERERLLEEAQAFFCRGIATDSYASGAKAAIISGSAEWKGYEYREGGFRLTDMYLVNPETKKSVGQTYILHDSKTIWIMSYGGFYKKEAVPCLKSALMESYLAGVFNAGRGRHMHRLGDCSYEISAQGTFEHFTARERVQCLVPREGRTPVYEPAGEHHMLGMALI
jgi:hypothetical protein